MKLLRVLLVAPERSLLASYRDALSRQGFSVSLVTSGLACLVEMRPSPPDVLVLELDTPWGGGDGVIARMKEDGDLPRVPVTFLLSWHDSQQLRGPMSVRVNEFTDQHMSPRRLAKRIRRLVDQDRQAVVGRSLEKKC